MCTRNWIGRPALLPALFLAILLAGCGGGNDTYSPTVTGPGAPDFTLTAPNPSATTAGNVNNVPFNLTLVSVSGFSSPVTLSVSGLPAGLQGQFDHATVTPTAAGVTSVLTVNAGDQFSTAGNYHLTVTATGGGITHTTALTLNFVAFTVGVSPPTQDLLNGGQIEYTVTVQPQAGFTGSVTLAVTGLPSNLNVNLAPNPVTIASGGARTSTLTLSYLVGTTSQTYQFTVTGTSGPTTASGSAAVRLNPIGSLHGTIQ